MGNGRGCARIAQGALGRARLRCGAPTRTRGSQVALRWVVQQGVPAVTASDNVDHLAGDLEVFSFELSDDEMDWLRSVAGEFKAHPPRSARRARKKRGNQ